MAHYYNKGLSFAIYSRWPAVLEQIVLYFGTRDCYAIINGATAGKLEVAG